MRRLHPGDRIIASGEGLGRLSAAFPAGIEHKSGQAAATWQAAGLDWPLDGEPCSAQV